MPKIAMLGVGSIVFRKTPRTGQRRGWAPCLESHFAGSSPFEKIFSRYGCNPFS